MSLGNLLKNIIRCREQGLGLYFHEAPLAESSIHRYCTPETQEVFACIGPEGGFSASETSMLDRSGLPPGLAGPSCPPG
jgi:16S rRNA U1498 N3-methylase RsmE